MIHKIVFLFFFLFTILYGEEYIDEENSDYNLGEGVQVGSLPLYIGGYISMDIRSRDKDTRYRLEDIALLGYGDYGKFSYMAELEFKEFYAQTVNKDGNSSVLTNTSLHTERLYLDYTFNENYMLRAGKYNSPIGFWNLLPINVLRDMSSTPYSSNIIFPRFTTGLAAKYSSFSDNELQIDVMVQNNDDFDSSYNNYRVDKHYGLGITYTQDALALKLNAGVFDNISKIDTTMEFRTYLLASLQYEKNTYKITSEIGTQKTKDSYVTKYAGYLEGVYYLTPKHAAIVRFEAYDNVKIGIKDELVTFGYTYRPLFPIAFKTEYRIDSLHVDNQFLFSFSVLF